MGIVRRILTFTLGLIILLSGISLFVLGWILTQSMIGFFVGAAAGTLLAILGIRLMRRVSEYRDDDPIPPNFF